VSGQVAPVFPCSVLSKIRTHLCHHQHLASHSLSTLTPDIHNVTSTDTLVTTGAQYQSLYLSNQSPSATDTAGRKKLGSSTTVEASARRLGGGQRRTTSCGRPRQGDPTSIASTVSPYKWRYQCMALRYRSYTFVSRYCMYL
jgi:hypothetical protein